MINVPRFNRICVFITFATKNVCFKKFHQHVFCYDSIASVIWYIASVIWYRLLPVFIATIINIWLSFSIAKSWDNYFFKGYLEVIVGIVVEQIIVNINYVHINILQMVQFQCAMHT